MSWLRLRFLLRDLPSLAAPAVASLLALAAWDTIVRLRHVPEYLLPGPLRVASALRGDWALLFPSLLVTLTVTLEALLAAAVLGAGLAVLLAQAAWI